MPQSNGSQPETTGDEQRSQDDVANETIATMATGPAFADYRLNIPCFGLIHCSPYLIAAGYPGLWTERHFTAVSGCSCGATCRHVDLQQSEEDR
jgi:hypothetical protein